VRDAFAEAFVEGQQMAGSARVGKSYRGHQFSSRGWIVGSERAASA
jgi:hypothetical protein